MEVLSLNFMVQRCHLTADFFGSSKENKTLVASQPHRETNQNRSVGCQTQEIRHVSDG